VPYEFSRTHLAVFFSARFWPGLSSARCHFPSLRRRVARRTRQQAHESYRGTGSLDSGPLVIRGVISLPIRIRAGVSGTVQVARRYVEETCTLLAIPIRIHTCASEPSPPAFVDATGIPFVFCRRTRRSSSRANMGTGQRIRTGETCESRGIP